MTLLSARGEAFDPRPAITAGVALVVVSCAWALGATAQRTAVTAMSLKSAVAMGSSSRVEDRVEIVGVL